MLIQLYLEKKGPCGKNWGMFFGLPRLGVAAVLLALFAFTPVSRAGLYEITFDDGNGNVGSGQIGVESAGNNNFYAASGYLDVTGGEASGVWTLYVAGG